MVQTLPQSAGCACAARREDRSCRTDCRPVGRRAALGHETDIGGLHRHLAVSLPAGVQIRSALILASCADRCAVALLQSALEAADLGSLDPHDVRSGHFAPIPASSTLLILLHRSQQDLIFGHVTMGIYVFRRPDAAAVGCRREWCGSRRNLSSPRCRCDGEKLLGSGSMSG